METTKNNRNIKIILVGGNTKDRLDFSDKWVKNIYSDKMKSHINSEFSVKEVEIEGVKYMINLWVYYSTDLNLIITKIFTFNSLGVVYFSDDDKDKISIVKSQIDDICRFEDGNKLPSILIGTDNDNEGELKEFAVKNEIDSVFKVSIKEGINVNESMEYLINIINKRMKESIGWENYFNKPKTKKLDSKNDKQKKNGNC